MNDIVIEPITVATEWDEAALDIIADGLSDEGGESNAYGLYFARVGRAIYTETEYGEQQVLTYATEADAIATFRIMNDDYSTWIARMDFSE